jgi:TatD DNase family protein
MPFVDVHAHLIHPRFTGEEDEVAQRARDAGLGAVIVNGLEPRSNREVLTLCARHEHLHAALGIYPIDAMAHLIDRETWPHDWDPPEAFDVDAEIAFINEQAPGLIEVAMAHDKPVILHSRRAEARTFEILVEMGVEKADFHCFTGKLKLARRIAEAGYYLSIPPAVVRDETFQRFARELPLDRLLTETDSPYMGPERGVRNEPANVPLGVTAMAKARQITPEAMAEAIAANFERLFGVPATSA